MNDTRPARVTGALFCLIGMVYFSGFVSSWFRENPFRGKTLQQTQARIISVEPGRLDQFPWYSKGKYFHYQFSVGGQNHQGKLFRKQSSFRVIEMGQLVEVEYLPDQPGINRERESSDTVWAPTVIFSFILVVLFLIGLVMLITGRDFITEWKQRR